MIIKRLTATFGRLINDTLTLKPGLNIISAPNESGKSTWCAFLRAMLYGISTSDRDKAGYLSDKTRFRPWSGAVMEGEMELTDTRYGDITITRTGTAKAPMRDFKAVYTGTGEPVSLTGENAGETLTGVSEQVFCRSAFAAQSGVKPGNTPELEKRISALVSSGDELASYTEADERLRTWLRRRRFNKSGEIPAAEARLYELREALERLETEALHTSKLRQELRDTEREAELLKRELSYYAAAEAAAEREKADEAKRRLDETVEIESELHKRLEAYGEPSAEILAEYRGELSALSALREVRDAERLKCGDVKTEFDEISKRASETVFKGEDVEQATAELVSLTPGSSLLPALKLILPLLATALIIIAVQVRAESLRLLTAGGAIIAVILLAAVLIRDRRQGRRLSNLLAKFNTASLSELYDRLDEQALLLTELERSRDTLTASERVLQSTELMYDNAQKALLRKLPADIAVLLTEPGAVMRELTAREDTLREYTDAKNERKKAEDRYKSARERSNAVQDCAAPQGPAPRRTFEETDAEFKRVTKKLELCRSEYNMALGTLQALGDPLVFRSGINELEARLNELNTQYGALTLAIDMLGKANTELQTRFSPLLSRTAEKYISALTDGRYKRLIFDKGLGASAKTQDDTVNRDALSLSQGAADQIYLALRLAICELVLDASPNPCPLILDDALVSFDDTRIKYALRLLLELSEHRQILLLTCQGREAALAAELSDSSDSINVITL